MTNPQKPINYSRLMTGSCNCPVGLPLPKVQKKNTFPLFCGFGVRTPSIVLKTIPNHLAVESLPRLKKELPMLSLGLRGTGVERLHCNACELI
jgi:hypothetical protein